MLAASTAREGGMPSGTGTTASAGTVKTALVRVEREYDPVLQRGRPGLDPSDRRIAVFHRKRERAAHERRPHALEFARRHPAVAHEALGAAADRAEERPHAHLAGRGLSDRLLAQLGPAGGDIPEGFGLHRFELYP